MYAVGQLTGQPAFDRDFLEEAPYLLSQRSVEMYAYVEQTGPDGKPVCASAWTDEPDLNIGERPACAGKVNRRSYVPKRAQYASLALQLNEVGTDSSRALELQEGWEVRGLAPYRVSEKDIVTNQRLKSHADHFYFNQYCIEAPAPECERIRFTTYRYDPAAQYVLVGAMAPDGRIGPFVDEKGQRHYYIAPHDHLAEIAD
jgi:hypothetical protein